MRAFLRRHRELRHALLIWVDGFMGTLLVLLVSSGVIRVSVEDPIPDWRIIDNVLLSALFSSAYVLFTYCRELVQEQIREDTTKGVGVPMEPPDDAVS